MGYLNEDGLARYDGLIKNWVTFKSGTVDGIDPLLNWQKTNTASSVAFYPLPAAPIDPVVNFTFTETDPAEGIKGPSNPSVITGVSSITITRCETTGIDSTDYTIALGNTYYGGSLDVASGMMTVTYTLEEISSDPFEVTTQGNVNVFRYKHSSQLQNNISYVNNNSACTHFSYVTSSSVGVDGYSFSNISLYFYSTTITTIAGFGAWLREQKNAGTPVLVVYPINAIYTVQLTPIQIYSLSQSNPYTPRINTVYSDQVSVQVGYPKSSQATSTELTNAIVSLGGNI